LENTLPKMVVGPKAHLKREAGLENTLPKVVGGSKEHKKGRQGWKTNYLRWLMALRRTKKRGRVGKHTT